MKRVSCLIIGTAMCLCFSGPAAAQQVKVGGTVYLDAYYHRFDSNAATWLLNLGMPWDKSDDWQQTELDVPDITRLYAKWTNDSGDVGMHIELGLGNGYRTGDAGFGMVNGSEVQNNSVRLRYAYGWWQICPVTRLTVGQADQVVSPLAPSQMLGGGSDFYHVLGFGFGNIGQGRDPMIRFDLTFNDNVGLAVSASDPREGWSQLWGNEENVWPRFDVAVPLTFGPVQVIPSAMWLKNKHDENNPLFLGADQVDSSYWVTAYCLSVKAAFGPFSISMEGAFGQNWSNQAPFPLSNLNSSEVIMEWFGGGANYDRNWALEDEDNAAFWVDAAFSIGPATIHAIYGIQESDTYVYFGHMEDEVEFERQMYGISVPIQVAPNFIIRPEFMVYDWGDFDAPDWLLPAWFGDLNLGTEYIGGIQFQVFF